jgi:hypothetical protein
MRMFKRRAGNDPDGNVTSTTADRGAYAPTRDDGPDRAPASGAYTTGAAPPASEPRTWHHGPTRALMTLLGVGVAGLLAWLTTNISDTSTGGYWAAYGILAGAGLVMALSQLLGGWTKWGRPSISPMVFLLAFVPALIAVGWIVVFHQPHGNWFRSHVVGWSGDIGIDGFVKDMGGELLTMLSFGLGLVFGFCLDTKRARRPAAAAPREQTMPRRADTDADRPMTREREQDQQPTTVRS